MSGVADVAIPKGFGLDVFPTEDADELAGIGIGSVWVFYSTRGALLA